MKQTKTQLSFFLLLFLIGCAEDIPIINVSSTYSVCNSRVSACAGNQIGQYCLFGYKWGQPQIFDDVGPDAVGPKTPGGTITFSFQDAGQLVNTHRQIEVPSESWSEILSCAQTKVKEAL